MQGHISNDLHFDIDGNVEDNVVYLFNEITYLPKRLEHEF